MDYCRTTGDVGTCENRPVTDECNGHFGPTRETEQLSYHYHVRLDPPVIQRRLLSSAQLFSVC